MKITITVSIFAFFLVGAIFQTSEAASVLKQKTILALGDSYTSGTAVDSNERFVDQVLSILAQKNILFTSPEVIANNGWTTQDLLQSMNVRPPKKSRYDFVTLLIGVNNQYQGLSTSDYEKEFTTLLTKAVTLSGNKISHVIVLSIPDYSVTPFASGRNRQKITKEIDEFNSINQRISADTGVSYIDVTPDTRMVAGDRSLIASDGLHPSGKEYRVWADKVADVIKTLSAEKKRRM